MTSATARTDGYPRWIASAALLATVLCVALLICEIAARLLDGQPLTQLRLLPPALRSAPPARLDPTLGGGPLPGEIDPRWLDSAPPAPKQLPVDPELLALVQSARGLDVKPTELTRVWNRNYVAANGCKSGHVLRRIPSPLLVFDLPGPNTHPVFRYPPSRTLPSGLVTNRFGWRGPDIPLDKPPRTIRLAFVGASTTVGLHNQPFSYPEYVVHWLNFWAKQAGLPLRFDGINAGREGIRSPDIAAIVDQELLPLEPDLVLYYEGANESLCTRRPSGVPSRPPRAGWWIAIDGLLLAAQSHLQLAHRLKEALLRIESGNGAEPEKPPLASWQMVPDKTHSQLSQHQLRSRLRNFAALESMREALAAKGGELALSSFAWLVQEGLRLNPIHHGVVFRHLNEWCWPYRYGDVRRDLDNQNHFLGAYAAAQGLTFIDVAGMFPSDPDLFFDSIHLNANGERVHAWIVLRALVSVVRAHLDSGAWPRPDQTPLREHPGIGPAYNFTLSCNPQA